MSRRCWLQGALSRRAERLWKDAEDAYKARILAAMPRDPSARLLDVGCDDGEWTDVLRRTLAIAPSQVSGLEIVDERADLARARGFIVQRADLEQRWPIEDKFVEVVHANQVIEHVKRLDHFVTEIRRVLTPGGLVVVCTENLASWHNVGALTLGFQPFSLVNISSVRPIGNPLAVHAGEAPWRAESWQHVHVMTLAALRDIFVVHGFEITDSWGTGYHPFPGRLGGRLAAFDSRHAHFIGLAARAPR
jgi:SAM-dependent methyltransferase